MSAADWSCEHCGRPTRDAPRTCDHCSGAMCLRCTDEHDGSDRCPVDLPQVRGVTPERP